MTKVIKELCPQDHRCPALRICPENALKQEGVAAPTIDSGSCTSCGLCVDYCPMGALQQD